LLSSQDSDWRFQDEGLLIKGPGYCPLESRSRFEVPIRGTHQLKAPGNPLLKSRSPLEVSLGGAGKLRELGRVVLSQDPKVRFQDEGPII